jgi:outer membrane protein TolC
MLNRISQKNLIFYGFRSVAFSRWTLYAFVILVIASGCSREHLKDEADEEVYGIITDKWQDNFGVMANYKPSDGAPNEAEIAEIIPPSSVINLAQSVAIATKYNREYQNQKESLYLSVLNLTLTRHQYARQWFGTIDASYKSSGETEEVPIESEVGFDHEQLLGDGIQIGTGLAIDWARFLTGDPQTSLGSVLTASVTAPLLGAGAGKVAQENLTQAERNVLYRIRSFNRYRKTFVVSLVNDYYRVLQQKERVKIAEASYKRLIESTNQLRMEVEVGQRPQYDLDEAQQKLLSSENDLVSERQRYEQTLDSFKMKLSLPTDANITLDQNDLTALAEVGISQPNYTESDAVKIALTNRLDLANARNELEDSERKVALAAEGLGVQLNLVGSANVTSKEETKFTQLQFDKGDYSVSMEADLPLDQKAERNAYREALITMQQRQRKYNEDIDRIRLEVRQAYRELAETAESYRIQKMGLKLAEKRVEVEKLLLEYGQGTVRRLLESEDALVQVQNAVTSALIDHTITKLSFFQDVGILRVRPDGMWEKQYNEKQYTEPET